MYDNYDDYVRYQAARAQSSKKLTVRYERKRKWILEKMRGLNVKGRTVLCVGARDQSEVEFFENNGFREVTGIDLFEGPKIVECDMSKIYAHKDLKYHRYDIVYSCESLEHCLDFDGFLRSLNVCCLNYFVCMCPVVDEPTQWDCNRTSFMEGLKDDDDLKKKLEAVFDEFNVLHCEIQKAGSRLFFILKRDPDKTAKKLFIEPVVRKTYDKRANFVEDLPKQAVCAELGIYAGYFAKYIILRADPKKYYAVDPYWRLYGQQFWYNHRSTYEKFLAFRDRIVLIDKKDVCVPVIEYSVEFLNMLPDNYLDWVYIDTTHTYYDLKRELDAAMPKVKDDGLICGHDYHTYVYDKHFGITRAIKEWLDEHPNYELYCLDNHLDWIIRKKQA